MGVEGLFDFFRKKYPDVFRTVYFHQFRGKSFAIDVSGLIWKFKVTNPNNWLTTFANFIFALRRNQIHPIFVFDGKPPPEKESERASRQQQRIQLKEKTAQLREDLDKYYAEGEASQLLLEKSLELRPNTLANVVHAPLLEQKYHKMNAQINNFTDEDKQKLLTLFNLSGVRVLKAPSEAETLCASLYHEGKVSAVVSGDSDVCVYQVGTFLYDISHFSETATEVDFQRILRLTGLTAAQFVDFCIMCKVDYNSRMPGIGPVKAFALIKEHGSIEAIGALGTYDISVLNHIKAREIFNTRQSVMTEVICGPPNKIELYNFLVLNNSRIQYEAIEEAYAPPKIVFE